MPNANTIEDFTEEIVETRFVKQYNFFHMLTRMLSLCLALMTLLFSQPFPTDSLEITACRI